MGLVFALAGCASPASTPPLGAQQDLPSAHDNIATPTSLVTPTSVQAHPTPSMQASLVPSPTMIVKASATAMPTLAATPTLTPTPLVTPTELAALPSPTLATLDETTRTRIFDAVADTIEKNYLYANFRGLDWPSMRTSYRKRALQAVTSVEFYAAISAMVDQLGDNHSRYLSPQVAAAKDAVSTGGVYVGIGLLESQGVVLGIYQDSPAQQAGLRRGDRILSVDGHPWGTAGASLEGPQGSSVTLHVQSAEGAPRDVAVERRAIVAKLLPEAYWLDESNIVYVAIPSFFEQDMGEQVHVALANVVQSRQPDGLIVDVRENGGGWRPVLDDVLSNFMEGTAGDFYGHSKSYALEIVPNDLYTRLHAVPLVILVDRQTQSYAEVFAAALQAAGRARVIGVTTAGNTETIYAHDFEDQSRLWLAQEGFRLPSGVNLEGRGVVPDVVLRVDWAKYNILNDPQVVKALELLKPK